MAARPGGPVPDEIAALVRASSAGDAGAWEALVVRFSGLVWSVIRGYRLGQADAADAFQTTWLRLAEHIGRLQSTRVRRRLARDYGPARVPQSDPGAPESRAG